MIETNKREIGKQLEYSVSEKLQEVDKYARPTKASGARTEIGDVINKYCFVQCKVSNTSKNINIKIKDWNKLIEETPIGSIKNHIFANQNSEGKKFITLDFDDFFRIYIDYIKLKEERCAK
jgi:hypothetical protein